MRARLRRDARQGGARNAGSAGAGLREVICTTADSPRALPAGGDRRHGARGARRLVDGRQRADPRRHRRGDAGGSPRRRGRLHLLDRSGAWYPAATIAAPPRRSRTHVSSLFLLAPSSASRSTPCVPALASAQSDLSSCKVTLRRCGPIEQLEDNAVLRHRGTARAHPLRRPAVLRGLRRDVLEAGYGHRAGPRRVTCRAATGSGPTGWSSTPGRAPACSTTRAARHARRPGREHRPQHVRRPGARSRVLGRSVDKARAEEIPDRERRVHDLRPADTPLGGRLRARSP